jgi:RNA-directed DNA polymerase
VLVVCINPQGEESSINTKSFAVSKGWVWQAWQRVKANGGSAGVDRVTIARYEANEKHRLYKLWNRMASGSYFPSPVRRVRIPKGKGQTRPLGIPTVEDRIAQQVVKMVLEPALEPHFHPDSYGYRPGKSAIDAMAKARQRCWAYDWVIEVDIQGFFDTIDHARLLKAVRHHTPHRWIWLYIERWLTAPVQHPDGRLEERPQGTPQGGVISPLLANLFLHYGMDRWVGKTHPDIKFERYADDVVFHCRSREEAESFLEALRQRMTECGLVLHPTKTRIVYCQDSNRPRMHQATISFDFLGYTFKPRKVINPRKQVFTGFTPAMSGKSLKRIMDDVRSMRLQGRSGSTVQEIAALLNPKVRGWMNYFGHFGRHRLHRLADWLDRVLLRWARYKYKRLKRSYRKTQRYLDQLRAQQPYLFVHWDRVKKDSMRRAV